MKVFSIKKLCEKAEVSYPSVIVGLKYGRPESIKPEIRAALVKAAEKGLAELKEQMR